MTDFGHSVLAHARQVFDEVQAAASLAQHRQTEPSGRLRVSMPGDFANSVLSEVLADFIRRYPAIALEIDLSPRRVDLTGENFDLTIRIGDLPDDATLAARRLTDFRLGLYAAPSYLKRRGVPSEPEALMEHDALQLLSLRDSSPDLGLRRGGEARRDGIPPTRAGANSPELLMRMACAGAGITAVVHHFAGPYVMRGELTPLLLDWGLSGRCSRGAA